MGMYGAGFSQTGYTLIAKSAKNEKCIARYFASLFSHFALGLAFTRKVKGFRDLFFCGINKTQNLRKMRKVYCECFVFHGVFREKTRKMRKVYSQPHNMVQFMFNYNAWRFLKNYEIFGKF